MKNNLTTSNQVKNTRGVWVHFKMEPTDYSQEQEVQIRFCQKTSKTACRALKNNLQTAEIKINSYQNDDKRQVWRNRETAHDLKCATSSIRHSRGSVTAWARMMTWLLIEVAG